MNTLKHVCFLAGIMAFVVLLGMSFPIEQNTQANDADGVAAADAAAPKGPVLKILKRRQRGLTVRNIARVVQEMKATGELEDYVSVASDGTKELNGSALAVAVTFKLTQENPKGWIDWENIDWDAIIKFVEQIIELLMKIIPLFVDIGPAMDVDGIAAWEAPLALAA